MVQGAIHLLNHMKPLDLTKPIQTRDGRPAKFLHKLDNPKAPFPVIAVTGPKGEEVQSSFTESGTYCASQNENCNDLINVPVKHIREYWVNCYDNGKELFWDTRERADTFYADSKRIACKKIAFEFEEGEGL